LLCAVGLIKSYLSKQTNKQTYPGSDEISIEHADVIMTAAVDAGYDEIKVVQLTYS